MASTSTGLRTKVVSILLTAFLAASSALPAFAEEVHRFDITSADTATAIHAFARQSGVQILAAGDVTTNKRLNSLAGNHSTDEGLRLLLEGTGLTHHYIGDRAVAVVAAIEAVSDGREAAETTRTQHGSEPRNQKEGSRGFWDRFRLAQAEPSSSSSEQQASQDVRRNAEIQQIDEILVTGSRLRRTEGETASPVIVFDREKIEQLGVSSLPDILKYSTQQTFTKAEMFEISGAQFAQLRGLPVGSTTVLVNGRRTVVSAANANANGLDLNMIPSAAIERVEVLADSASAMYGADAIGGVVNVILKKDVSRPTIDLRYASADGGGQERHASMTAGYSGERFRGSVVLDYFDQEPLLGEERDRWANRDYRRFGGTDFRVATSNPASVASSTTSNLPGLSSRFALIRPGSTGVGLTPADLIAVPTDVDTRTESLSRFEAIIREKTRRGATLSGELDFSDTISMFADGFYSKHEIFGQTAPFAATLTVPGNNPFNTFGVPVSARYLFEGLGPQRHRLEEDLYSATVGLKGSLKSWDWEVSALQAVSTVSNTQNRNTVNIAQANCLLTNPATRAPGACGGITEALNVFQDGAGGSAALLDSLRGLPSIVANRTEGTQVTAFLRGAAFVLPAGSVDVVAGATAGSDDMTITTISPNFSRIAGDRESSAVFAEMRIPLIATAMEVPAVRSLTLKLAARGDHYSDFGDTFNPQYGVIWSPIANLSLTASYGTSFSPPSLFQLYRPSSPTLNFSVADPRRNNEPALVTLFSGGNPHLEAEEGASFITGLVLTPMFMPGLRLTTHYWNVELENRIANLGFAQILAYESLFAERVVRAAPDAPGLPGRLVSIDQSVMNFARLETSGVDWSASYPLNTGWGRFTPTLSATWTESFEVKDAPNIPVAERVGTYHVSGTIPRWRAVASLSWQKQGLSLSLNTRYLQGFTQLGRSVPSRTLVDMQASVEMDDLLALGGLGSNLRIAAGASNLFDKEPPFVNNLYGFDWSQGDLIGRVVYVTLSKGF